MAETQRRPVPHINATEVETALSFLDFQRDVVHIKCQGLTEPQLREVWVESGTNLLGLVRHLTVSERYWFAHHLAGEPGPGKWDFRMEVDPATPTQQVLDDYAAACAHSNECVRRVGDPNALTALPVAIEKVSSGFKEGKPLPMRWVLAHMTTETARHAGHADIIREQIDGATGR